MRVFITATGVQFTIRIECEDGVYEYEGRWVDGVGCMGGGCELGMMHVGRLYGGLAGYLDGMGLGGLVGEIRELEGG